MITLEMVQMRFIRMLPGRQHFHYGERVEFVTLEQRWLMADLITDEMYRGELITEET